MGEARRVCPCPLNVVGARVAPVLIVIKSTTYNPLQTLCRQFSCEDGTKLKIYEFVGRLLR